MWYPTLPLISSFSITVQLSILTILLVLSYLNRPIRIGVLATIAALFALKLLIPLFNWGLWLFKAIAWAGFYVYFFQIAVGYAGQAVGMVETLGDGLGMLFKELEKLDMKRAAEAKVQTEMMNDHDDKDVGG